MTADGDFILDISAVPMPPEEEIESIADEFPNGRETAFKMAFLGIGQGGGRIAAQFYQYGYRRVCAVNTAGADLNPLDLPKNNKLMIGPGAGAGGNPKMGARIMEAERENVFTLMRNCYGADFDRIVICATAGGGTGAGGVFEAIKIAHDLIDKLELRNSNAKDPQVGVIIALPKEGDGKGAQVSAYTTLTELTKMVEGAPSISPLVIIDNQRLEKLYPKVATGQFWATANHAVCSLFHLLNLVSAQESKYTSFDKKDFESVLQSGLVVFGSTQVKDWAKREGISTALRENLSRNLLTSGIDLKTGTVAGCVIVASPKILDNDLPQENIEEGLTMMGRTIQARGSVKHGIYAGSNDVVVVYTIIGGLQPPTERIAQLQRAGGTGQDWDGA